MTTPSHIIYNLIALGSKKDTKRNWAVFWGALIPDIPITIAISFFFIFSGFSFDMTTWDLFYFTSPLAPVFQLSHSFFVWIPFLLFFLVYKKRLGIYLCSSACMHIIFDFFLHAQDAYMHLYPFSMWKWHSPISYWNPMYYGNIVSCIEYGIGILLLLLLLKRAKKKVWRYVSILGLMFFTVTFII